MAGSAGIPGHSSTNMSTLLTMQPEQPTIVKKTRIVIVDDHQLIRQMWRLILADGEQVEIVGESGELKEAIEMVKALHPDVVLLDINLGLYSGLDAVPVIRKFSPGTQIMIVSMHTQAAYVKRTLQLGVKAYITKNSSKEEMLKAIEVVMKGGIYICDEIKQFKADETFNNEEIPCIKKLSLREIEIIKLIKEGYSSKAISLQLHIGSRTVEVHRYNMLKKLKLKNTAALINFVNNTDLNFI